MTAFHLITFGGLAIEQGSGPAPTTGTQRKALVLLAVVAATGAPGVPREKLTALLWPESDAERARGALNQMLHGLRRQLGSPDAVCGTASLSLDPAYIDSDISSFRAALETGDFETAARLYAGPFLDGVHIDGTDELERWIEAERRRLAELHCGSLEQLARAADSRGDRLGAVTWWRRAQAVDPMNGRIAMGLMRSLQAAGDGAGAIQHARVHESLVHQEIGAPPDPAVKALATSIAADRTRGEAPRAEANARPAPDLLPASPSVTHVPTAASPRRRRLFAVLGATVVLAVAATALVSRLTSDRTGAEPNVRRPAPSSGGRRVAVAVFANRTGDPHLDRLGLMASDWVTRGLTGSTLIDVIDVGALYVQGRSPLGEPTDAASLARRTGATLVVDGSYYRAGDSVRFSTNLVDVATGRVLRALDPISADTADPLSAVDELRQRVATGLATVVDPRASVFIPPATRPPRYESYQEFVLAQDLYWRGGFDAATPHFRRAVALDPTFYVAATWLAGNAASVGRCDLVDSVTRALDSKLQEIGQWERITLRLSHARCESDWDEHNRLLRARMALQPGSGFAWWALGVGARQMNRPGEALANLNSLDPSRDLAWLSDSGKILYWREVAAAHHASGNFVSEAAVASRMARGGHGRLAAAYVTARALAGGGDGAGALSALADVGTMQREPALVGGFTGHMRPPEVATPGWVLYQIGTELQAHGGSAFARTALERSASWFAHQTEAGPLPPEQRFFHAQALVALGALPQARVLLDQLVREDSADEQRRGALGVAAALAGDTATAHRVERELAADPVRSPPGAATLARAQIAAARGDRAAALDLLDALPKGAHPYNFGSLHSDPAFATLRTEPRFLRLLSPRG
jgi:DNA-binding SARP family transcriptional activator/TolB-like protein